MRKLNLEKRITSLQRELTEAKAQLTSLNKGGQLRSDVQFSDLFDIDEIQAIQDAFANATGVASIITAPDGEPITRPSNFCRLCESVIRETEAGLCNCKKSDAVIGRYNAGGPIIQPCLSGGLWDGGASISVDGRHIANWLVGQIRNEYVDEERMVEYAREIGADETAFIRALGEVTVMSLDQFKEVCQTLYLLANLMSWTAYQNILLMDSITEVRESHEKVSSLKKFLSNIIDSMPSILVGVDADGKVTHWNMRAVDATGLQHEQAKGRLLVDVLPKFSGEMQNVVKAIAERAPVIAKRVPEESEDGIRYNDVSVYPLIANGVQGAVIRVDDITEKVRIEEMMIQSEKMMSVGGLAAGLAHEVNNPLAAILGNAQLMRKRLLEDSTRNRRVAEDLGLDFDAVMEYVRRREADTMIKAILESGQRAGSVVTNMLGFSRKSDGDTHFENPVDILEKSVELVKSGHDLKNSYNFKDIEFVREYDEDIPSVCCEASKLQQVLFNILNNGAQAMTSSYRTTGRTPQFILRCHKQGDSLRLEIEDNGPGMKPEVRDRVFEPFFTTKEAGVGTGLGMSVSYFIVTEGLGGTLTLDSAPDDGATFTIRLPLE